MQFINILMLFGLLAVAVPVIIQLLNRKSFKKILWGAMIFIRDSMRKRRRRLLLEEVLLLACRCLIPALLALAFARPFIQPESSVPWLVVMPVILLSITAFGVSFALWRYPFWRRITFWSAVLLFAASLGMVVFEEWLNLKRFGRGASKDVVLVLDGSSSMSMITAGGKSNFENAVEEARTYIDKAPRETAFSIIVGGPVPQVLNPVPIADKRVLFDTLSQAKPSNGTMQMMGVFTSAAVALSSGHNGVKQIIVIGDGQEAGWNVDSEESWRTVRRIFERLPSEPVVVWRTLPLPASIRNVAVSGVSLTRDVVGTDREVGIRVSVLNSGMEAVTPDEVSLRIGTRTMTAKNVKQLKPGESQTFEFSHKFSEPGAALVVAEVSAGDDLPADDTFNYVVPVMDSLGVLVIDGSPPGNVFRRASTFVSLALRPELSHLLGEGQNAASNPRAGADFMLNTKVVDVTQASRMNDFSAYGVVVLADVARLPQRTLDLISEYVKVGGGLLFLPGAHSRPDVFNGWTCGTDPVLPLRLDKWTSAGGSASDAEGAGADAVRSFIDTQSFSHDSLHSLRTGTDLSSVEPQQFWRLDEGPAGAAYVAARFADGNPFLAFKQIGRGTVAMSAMPFDSSVSDIVSKRGFLPLVHEIVYFLARPASAELNIRPMAGANLFLSNGAGTFDGGDEIRADSGLWGMYYRSKGIQGVPEKRLDRKVDFNWGGGSPMNNFPSDNFSVKWIGSLVAPESGRYEFVLNADDRASLKIGGKRASAADLEKGKSYPIEITYEEDYGEARVDFCWKTPSGQFGVVPEEALSPRVVLGVEGSGDIVEVTDPHGDKFFAEILELEAGITLRVSRSLTPGLYSVNAPESMKTVLAPAIMPGNKIMFSVSAGVEESRVEAMTVEDMEKLQTYIPISNATKQEDVLNALHGQAFGKEVWRVLAAAAFIFLILEVVLTRWIAIQRRTGEEIDVEFRNDQLQASEAFKASVGKILSK